MKTGRKRHDLGLWEMSKTWAEWLANGLAGKASKQLAVATALLRILGAVCKEKSCFAGLMGAFKGIKQSAAFQKWITCHLAHLALEKGEKFWGLKSHLPFPLVRFYSFIKKIVMHYPQLKWMDNMFNFQKAYWRLPNSSASSKSINVLFKKFLGTLLKIYVLHQGKQIPIKKETWLACNCPILTKTAALGSTTPA